MLLCRRKAADIGIDHHRIIGIVYDEPRLSTARFFYVLLFRVIDLHFFQPPPFGIVRCQPGRIFKGADGRLFTLGLQHHMGAGDSLSMEPPVIAGSEAKGELLVLIVIFPHIDIIAVRAGIVEGTAGDFGFFRAAFSTDVAAFNEFLPDLDEIIFLLGNIQRIDDGFQMKDFGLCVLGKLGEGFKRPFLFIIFFKIFFCIFPGSK